MSARRLDAATERSVREVWTRRLRAPDGAFDGDELTLVDRPDLSAVVIVRLGEGTVVAAPGDTPADLKAGRRTGARAGSRGTPVAAAGFEVWDERLAHLGLAVAPAHRNDGPGRGVAIAAVHAALEDGLVAQWRCRQGNQPSARVRHALGFVTCGRQIAFDVGAVGG